ncbi:hypothetical protein HU200_053731 [Digitaria exilis]|uniref:Uncharacterized protein n=1 Tax=Digitaria exilis TaxID=1010633 RepID=A0A835AIY4_9POAL|nr:hypothetical protein HU200_053731 [Digitaria exilis]
MGLEARRRHWHIDTRCFPAALGTADVDVGCHREKKCDTIYIKVPRLSNKFDKDTSGDVHTLTGSLPGVSIDDLWLFAHKLVVVRHETTGSLTPCNGRSDSLYRRSNVLMNFDLGWKEMCDVSIAYEATSSASYHRSTSSASYHRSPPSRHRMWSETIGRFDFLQDCAPPPRALWAQFI